MSEPRPHWRPRVCAHCGAPITPNEAVRGGHCTARACADAARSKAVAAVAPAREKERLRKRAAALEKAMPTVRRRQAQLGRAPTDAVIADVPFHARRPVPADPARHAAFLAQLAGIVATGFGRPPPGANAVAEAGAHRVSPTAAGVTACGACRGWCCQFGADSIAFLRPDDIALQRTRLPGEDEAGILARYAAHLPAESMEGSCVYHGARGCTLSRELRSGTCNAFRCFELRQIDDALARTQRPVLLAVARDGERPRALGAVDLQRAETDGLAAITIEPIGPALDDGAR